MKNLLKCFLSVLICLSGVLFSSENARAQLNVHFNLNVGAPGYYGPLNILQGVHPSVWNVQPVIAIGPVAISTEPIYLRVPNFQRKSWKKYCRKYGACQRPVYFVKNDWYEKEYGHRKPPKSFHRKHKHHDFDDGDLHKEMKKKWKKFKKHHGDD